MGIQWNKVLKAQNMKKEYKSKTYQKPNRTSDNKTSVKTQNSMSKPVTMKHISKNVSDFLKHIDC